MKLDPELEAALTAIPGGGLDPRLDDMAVVSAMRDTRAMLSALGLELDSDPEVTVENRSIPGPGDSTRTLRCYTPSVHDGGVLLFFHGGGYILGDVYTEETRCLRLASGGRCIVVSAEYALAPEDPYPAAVDDGFRALEWVAAHAGELGGDGSRLAVGGSSAGGGLAAAVALMARDRGGPALDFQLLVYPMLDDRMDSASMRHSEHMVLLNGRAMDVFWGYYLGGQPGDCYAAPARAEDLSGLPPAYVSVSEHDPLRDEGIEYARRLAAAGVTTELHQFPGTFHGFDLVAPRSKLSKRALGEQAEVVRRALA